MVFSLRRISRSVSRTNGTWLTLLFLFTVLVPSAGLLWFVQRAARNERLAVREQLTDVYRAHLAFARERVTGHWERLATRLTATGDDPAARSRVARELQQSGEIDAVIWPSPAPDADPTRSRPSVPGISTDTQRLEITNPTAAARRYADLAAAVDSPRQQALALQGQARALTRAGDPLAALAVLQGTLQAPQFANIADPQGRLFLPNINLMALELAEEHQPEQVAALVGQLRDRLIAPEALPLPSAQRRFLLGALEQRLPEDKTVTRAMAGESLAEAWRSTPPVEGVPLALVPSSLAGVFQFAPQRESAVTLHRLENIRHQLQSVAQAPNVPDPVRLELQPPDTSLPDALLTLPVGGHMPGWHLALLLNDRSALDDAADRRVAIYIWTGSLLVLGVVVLALLVNQAIRRQLALTRLRNDLVANVTHELKTPLASMRLFVDTLLDAPVLDEKLARDYLRLIAAENLRLSRLIDNFLTFSRIEHGRHEFRIEPTSPDLLLEAAVETVRERFAISDCQLVWQVAPKLPDVPADTDALVTALHNLLDNAHKYSAPPRRIVIGARRANNGKLVELFIQDNGPGIAPRDLKRVFQRFVQVRHSASPTSGGCGLGLSIVQLIVRAHGGTVRVESELGHGSTFVITLPGAPSPTPSSSDTEP